MPVELGAGCQTKVVDATSAGRACVVTPFTARPFGLVDGVSAVVRERTSPAFAEAVVALLDNPERRARLVAGARERLAAFSEGAVHDAWRRALAEVRPDVAQRRR
jgi:glycosyltransferase involved in cell wall biosynthesis